MKGLIFSEGNGYGHVSRDRLLSAHLGFPIMTFGKGAEYCRKNSMDFIEIPSPYRILSEKGKVKIATDYSGLSELFHPEVLSRILGHFERVDRIIVDGSPLGLAGAMLSRKKTIFITNDISALVGIQGEMRKRVAYSLLQRLLKYPESILVPDFPPPLSVSMQNLRTGLPLSFIGPLIEGVKQMKHKKKYAVTGPVENMVRPLLGESAVYASEVADIRAHFGNAELVISHGGHTTIMEALSHGKASLCIVDGAYPERANNATQLEKKDVGIMLDSSFLSAESLRASIDYALTLDRMRLSLYQRYASGSRPLDSIKALLG